MPGYLAARPGDVITPQEAAEVLGLPLAEAENWFLIVTVERGRLRRPVSRV